MVLLHIIFPQELFGLALQPPKQPNKMLTSRVCSDTSSIWCESVGIPRSHSSGSSWFVIWKKNCLNLSSKKQKLNSLGDVNCDVAMLHLNFIQLTYLRTEQLLRWDGKKNRAFRPSWDKRDPSSLDQVREQLLHALFKKNLFTLTSCSTEESTVLKFESCLCFSGIDQKIAPLIAWFGVDITIVYAAKYLKNEVTLKSFCWFLAKKYRMMTSWEVFFLFITFWDIWDISIFLTKKFDCQTAKIQRVYFRCSTDFESPWGSCPAKPGLRPEARTGGSDRVSHVWYIYSKSAILEMGFRTFRLKLCSKYTNVQFAIITPPPTPPRFLIFFFLEGTKKKNNSQ